MYTLYTSFLLSDCRDGSARTLFDDSSESSVVSSSVWEQVLKQTQRRAYLFTFYSEKSHWFTCLKRARSICFYYSIIVWIYIYTQSIELIVWTKKMLLLDEIRWHVCISMFIYITVRRNALQKTDYIYCLRSQ